MSSTSKRTLFQVSFILVACVAIEIALRCMGYTPGDLRPNWLWFQPVDSLYVINDFYVNDMGLQVADKSYWAEHDSVYINAAGFRSPEFDSARTGKKKVLLIGDSFVWGLSSTPLRDSSFADILRSTEHYEVLNAGIPATDPAQYAEVAKQYIPIVKPDYVFVFFFLGNDLMEKPREIVPNQPIGYWTNAGAISANMDGKHFANAHDAYYYIANEKYFLKKPNKWYEKLIAQSALLSRLYAGKFRIEEKLQYERKRKDSSVSLAYLQRVKSVAEQNAVPVKFVLIPELKEAGKSKQDLEERYSSLLSKAGLKTLWVFPPSQNEYYVPYPDGHLNNEGHRQYAKFLKSTLDSYFNK